MAKKPTISTLSSGYFSTSLLNANFTALQEAFDLFLSLDGATPNTMSAALDMNSQDILNTGALAVTSLTVGGATFVPNDAASIPDWEGAWLTATAYVVNDLVRDSGSTYICLTTHTSGTFSTDLGANLWELFAQQGAAGAGTGDMLAANDLSDVASVATSRVNLGLVIGTDVQAYAAALDNVSGTNTGDESTATTSAEGIVELATDAEGTTGTDTSKVPPVSAVVSMINERAGPDAVMEDQKSSGTNGGTATSGVWETRDLNTEVLDPDGLISISANTFTPTVAGWVNWSAPAQTVYTHQTRLYNVTDAAVVSVGTSEISDSGRQTSTRSFGGASIVASKAYRIEHRVNTTRSTDGYGNAASLGTEVFTRVEFWRSE